MGRQEITYDDTKEKYVSKLISTLDYTLKYLTPEMKDEWIRHIKLQNLRNRKKLCLVLDLDHTLLHTKQVDKLSPEEKICLCNSSRKDDLYGWKANGVDFLTKLRPFVLKFLQEASKLFDMYVYTNGSRDYARIMVGFLDPDRVYLASTIISKEDSTVKGQKGLDVVPVHKTGVLILDDTENVWARDHSNLVVIKPYDYFAPKVPNGTRSLCEEGTDESESAGPLSCAFRLLQEKHKSYFECYHMFVKEIQGILLEDHEERLMDENSLCDMGSRKRMRLNDGGSDTKSQRC